MNALTPRDPEPEYGPAMRAISPKWRLAVEALFATRGDMTKAIELAGYRGTRESLKVMASRIFADNRVRMAVKEVCNQRLDISEPEVLMATLEIAHNPGEKAADRLRALGMIWDRANPIMSKHKIEVEHHLSTDDRDIQHYRALQKIGAPRDAFLARFGPNGLSRVEAMIAAEDAKHREIEGPTIDVEFTEVAPDGAAAEAQAPAPFFDEDMET